MCTNFQMRYGPDKHTLRSLTLGTTSPCHGTPHDLLLATLSVHDDAKLKLPSEASGTSMVTAGSQALRGIHGRAFITEIRIDILFDMPPCPRIL
jgi:hypothetical protein